MLLGQGFHRARDGAFTAFAGPVRLGDDGDGGKAGVDQGSQMVRGKVRRASENERGGQRQALCFCCLTSFLRISWRFVFER